MAKQYGFLKLNGKVGDLSFQKVAGQWITKEIDPALSERVKTSPNYENVRLNARDFGNCMDVAKDVYAAILGKRETMYLNTRHPLGMIQKYLLERMRDHEEELGHRGLTGLDLVACTDKINGLAKRRLEGYYFQPQLGVGPKVVTLNAISGDEARRIAQQYGCDFLRVEVIRTATIGGIAVDAAGKAHRTWEAPAGSFNMAFRAVSYWPRPVADDDAELTWEEPMPIPCAYTSPAQATLTDANFYQVRIIPCKIESIQANRVTWSELISDASMALYKPQEESKIFSLKVVDLGQIPSEMTHVKATLNIMSTGSSRDQIELDGTINEVLNKLEETTTTLDVEYVSIVIQGRNAATLSAATKTWMPNKIYSNGHEFPVIEGNQYNFNYVTADNWEEEEE